MGPGKRRGALAALGWARLAWWGGGGAGGAWLWIGTG